MQKERTFKDVFFDTLSIQEGIENFKKISKFEDKYEFQYLSVSFENEKWLHDSLDEFYVDYRKIFKSVSLNLIVREFGIKIEVNKYFGDTIISVSAPSRKEIEIILSFFENNHAKFQIEKKELEEREKPIIFIGHGRSNQWRDLKDHLSDKHNYKIRAYETGARAGHTIRDILEEMSDVSSFALLVMTGEDEGKDGQMKARPNVIHETGLFQGKIGFSRAIVLLENGTEEFSNLHGIQQIRFNKENIKETFGDVIATINREFGEV